MRCLLLTQDFPPRPGGMARYYADLARGLGASCTVAAGSWEGSPPRIRGDHRVLPLPFDASRSHRPWNLVRAARRVSAGLAAGDADTLVCGNIRPFGPAGVRLARRHGVRLVMIYHGGDILQTARKWRSHPVKHRRWQQLTEAPALHVVNSGYTAGLAVRLGFPGDRIAVVPPEVDTTHFRPPRDGAERREIRRGLGWSEDTLVTLFSGRLVDRKGLEDLFIALAAQPGHVRLVVAGPGNIPLWRSRAGESGVADRVDLLGPVEYRDLALLYRGADLFAGPSRDTEEGDDPETFGIVFLEASASGLPVLATRTGGVPEAVEDEVGGILVTPGDAQDLAGAWSRLVADGELRQRLGQGGLRGRAARHGTGSSARNLVEAVRAGF